MKNVDIKILALSIVGTVLILLAIGGVINAATDGEGLDPAVASAAFASVSEGSAPACCPSCCSWSFCSSCCPALTPAAM